MHLYMYVPAPVPQAKLVIYTQRDDGVWDNDEWYAPTLDEVAAAAKLDLGAMNDAYQLLVSLGVDQVSLTSYTKDGNDTDDPAVAKLWSANCRHPQNSGMSHTGKGNTAAAAILDAAKIEADRQRHALEASAAYHEQQAKQNRERLEGMTRP